MRKTRFLTLSLLLSTLFFSGWKVSAQIVGPSNICLGIPYTFTDTAGGGTGTWSSSAPAIAGAGSATGVITGLSAGITTISYTAGSLIDVMTVTVNPLPGTISGYSGLCLGGTISLTDGTSGGTWSSSNPAVASVSAFGIVTGAATGTATISYTLPTGCNSRAVVSITPLPVVFSLSFSGGSTICGGGPGSNLVLSGSQTGMSYQLYRNGSPVYGSITGTGTSINFGAQTIAGIYSVVATNTATLCTKNMDTATLTVTTPVTPSVSISATPGDTVCAGTVVTFTASPVNGGSSPGYAWMLNGVNVSSGTSYSYTPADGDIIHAVLTSSAACASPATAISTSLIMHVSSLPAITGASSLCAGSTATLSSSVSGGVWSSSATAVAVVIPSTGFVTSIASGTATISYTGPTGCVGTHTIFINALPATHTVSGGGSYCPGGLGLPVTLNGSETGVSYQLMAGGVFTGAPITGTGATLDFGPQTAAATYTVVAASGLTGCARTMTGSATVGLYPLPPVHSVGGGGSYCAGGTGEHIITDGSDPGISYQVFNGSGAVGFSASGTGGVLDFGTFTSAGIYTIAATNISTGCSVSMAGTATIFVNPLPASYTVTGGGSYCAGGVGPHVGLSSSDADVSYELMRGSLSTGIILPGSSSAIDFGAQSIAGTYYIRAVNVLTGCTGAMSGNAIISINALPDTFTDLASPSAICIGGPGAHIFLDGSQAGVNYQLYHAGLATGSAVAGTGTVIDFGAVTLGGTYTVVATNATTLCTTNMAGVGSVVVNSLPVAYNVAGGGSYCGGSGGVSVALSGSSAGISYQLYNGTTPVGIPVSGTGSALNFGLQTAAGTYIVLARNVATSCTSNMTGSAVVSIITPLIPSVTISASAGDTVCSGTVDTFTATIVNGGSAPLYQWLVNGNPVTGVTGNSYNFTVTNDDSIAVEISGIDICVSPATASGSITAHIIDVPSIAGTTAVCAGASEVLSDSLSGGIWSTGDPAIATIATVGGATGVVTGVTAGTANMTYTLSGSGCYTTTAITVNALPAISASAASAGCGGGYTLSASGGSTYTWSPSTGIGCTTCATTTANPPTTLLYTLTGTSSAGCTNTDTVTLNGNTISGHISYSGVPTDVMKVWLIQFNASDSSLTAIDSTLSCMDSGTPYYEFDNKPIGSYMVKAKLEGTTPGASGYIPTYSLSTPYWSAAASVAHVTSADTLHINMIYGTVPAGPGFIGGLISAGAGRGTGDVAAPGMLVYLKDAISGFVVTYTYTDEAGAYSFTNIGYGNYVVYPEAFSFATIPSAMALLSPDADSVKGVNFRQYNDSRVIKPATAAGVSVASQAAASASLVNVYPNPTTGLLHIQWGAAARGNATVMVTDVTGREVHQGTVDIDTARNSNPATPVSLIDLSGLKEGVYIISIKSGNINYSGKVIIR